MHIQYGKIQYLDGWRGLAILMVLISHFFNIPGIREGRLGVDLFFVLSGLLMANILFLKRPPLGTFYKRRISRVLPLAFLYITVAYSGSIITGQYFTTTEVISTYLFLRTYIPETPHIWSGNVPINHFWSLNVEEHCYLLMGIMTIFIRNSTRAGYMLVGLGLAAIATNIGYVYSENRPIESSLRTECASAPLFYQQGIF